MAISRRKPAIIMWRKYLAKSNVALSGVFGYKRLAGEMKYQ
jgi:hypothetical protein